MTYLGYSILTALFAEKKEKVMAYAETAVGVGLVSGPILGVTMYNSMGYFTCYLILSVLLIVSVVLMQLLLPGVLNETSSSNEEQAPPATT
jgi:MFS family permease